VDLDLVFRVSIDLDLVLKFSINLDLIFKFCLRVKYIILSLFFSSKLMIHFMSHVLILSYMTLYVK
jgi:hypothetical protein